MKIRTIVFVCLFLASCNISVAKEEFTEGYKNANWGMTPDAVKKAFPDQKFFDEKGIIYFLTTLGEDKATIAFVFVEEKLYRVGIVFDVKTSNKDLYLEKFNFYEDLLKKKYGLPKQNIRNVNKDGLDYDEAMVISMGKGAYYDLWETNESKIMLSLSGDNFDLTLRIMYECAKLGVEGSRIQEKHTLENL